MSHNLVTLLQGGPDEALALRELRLLAHDGVDVRLIADILSRAHQVMRQLGLDPADASADEVYQALLAAVKSEQFYSLLERTEFVLLEVDDQVISFNPIDVINNFHHELPMEQRQTAAAKKGLGWEITRRYQSSPEVNPQRLAVATERTNWPTEEPQFCRVVFGKPAILAIGDTATEAMITLGHNDLEITGKDHSRTMSIRLGAKIMADTTIITDAVGGAANASVAFSRLGLQASLMSWLGDDTVGHSSRQHLRQSGIDMSGVQTGKGMRTNYHYVFRSGAERTIIAQYEDYDYRWRAPTCRHDWVYLSMMSADSWEFHQELLSYLEQNPAIKLAFQPGPAHLSWGRVKLESLLNRTEVMVLNADEAMILTGSSTRSVETLLEDLHKLGPKVIVMTDGPRGAYAYNGTERLAVPSFPDPSRPLDRTGAGDAFAATIVAELASGSDIKTALLRAPVNSMSVVQYMGPQAGLLSTQEIDELITSADEDYSVKSL